LKDDERLGGRRTTFSDERNSPNIAKNIRSLTRSTKERSYFTRMLHSGLHFDKDLHLFGHKDSSLCTKHSVDNDFIHGIYFCDLATRHNILSLLNINLTRQNELFGNNNFGIQWVILNLNMYIHISYLDNSSVTLHGFLAFLDSKIDTELRHAKEHHKTKGFEIKLMRICKGNPQIVNILHLDKVIKHLESLNSKPAEQI